MGDHQEVHRFMRLNLALGIALLAGKAVFGQLPESGTLSAEDERAFRAELFRLERLLETATDRATVEYADNCAIVFAVSG